MNPLVGVLIEPFTYLGIKEGDTGREHLPYYDKGGEIYGIKPCFFRLSDIDFASGEVFAYIIENAVYKRRRLPIPRVIHNRILLKGKRDRERMRKLSGMGTIIFNSHNRFSKWSMHKLLESNDALRPYLPKTYKATSQSIRMMMQRYEHLIVKPENGSVGKGILKLDRVGPLWQASYPIPKGEHGQKWTQELYQSTLPSAIATRLNRHSYIVQERIPLAKYNDAPFDLRVSVQRNILGEWQVTGMVAKVASKGHFLTNVARGGKTYTLEQILQQHPTLELHQVRNSVESLSLKIAHFIGRKLPFMADLGLDIGITEDGYPYFIECNARDLRITFRNATMNEEWEATHTTPMGYAAYILKRTLM